MSGFMKNTTPVGILKNANPQGILKHATPGTANAGAAAPASTQWKPGPTLYPGHYTVHVNQTLEQNKEKQVPEEMQVDKPEGATTGKRRRTFPFKKNAKRPKLEPKNPVLLLNELHAGLEYKCVESDKGAYKFSITVNGVEYVGEAQSKKEARQHAAENALRGQIALGNNDIWEKLARRVTATAPDAELPDNVSNEQLLKLIETKPAVTTPGPKEKHPVMLLNEYAGDGLNYECISEEGQGGKRRYTMRVKVNEEEFDGTARNRKAAKSQAARLALAKLFNVFVPENDVVSTNMSIVKDSVTMLAELHRTPLYYEMIENSGAGGSRVIVMKTVVNGIPFEGKGKTKKQAKALAAQSALSQIYGLTGEVPMSHIGGVSLFRSPITVLQHYNGPNTVYELTETVEGLSKFITASVTVSEEKFVGTGSTKKAAKCMAAKNALKGAYKIDIPDEPTIPPAVEMMSRRGFGKKRGARLPFGRFNVPYYNDYSYSGYTSFVSPIPQKLNQMMPNKANIKATANINFNGKTPTQILGEIHKDTVNYECIKTEGSLPNMQYTMKAVVNGKPYEGTGRSKKEAKWSAARAALADIYKISTEATTVPEQATPAAPIGPMMFPPHPMVGATNGTAVKAEKRAEMHPVMLLNQLANRKHEYTCINEEGEGANKIYTMQVVSAEKTYIGQARNKKDAKATAARSALAELYHVQQS